MEKLDQRHNKLHRKLLNMRKNAKSDHQITNFKPTSSNIIVGTISYGYFLFSWTKLLSYNWQLFRILRLQYSEAFNVLRSYWTSKIMVYCSRNASIGLEIDSDSQFSSKEFQTFQQTWNFKHKTYSPRFPRANGLAERNVQLAKKILRKCWVGNPDIYLDLLNFRNTSRNKDMGSPNERLMSRITNSTFNMKIKTKKDRSYKWNINKIKEQTKKYGDKTDIITFTKQGL